MSTPEKKFLLYPEDGDWFLRAWLGANDSDHDRDEKVGVKVAGGGGLRAVAYGCDLSTVLAILAEEGITECECEIKTPADVEAEEAAKAQAAAHPEEFENLDCYFDGIADRFKRGSRAENHFRTVADSIRRDAALLGAWLEKPKWKIQ